MPFTRTPVDLLHKETEELESLLGSRLLADPFLLSLLEELAHRQIDKEHKKLETAKGDQVIESQGIIRGTRYFLDLSATQKLKFEGLDREKGQA